jgi:sugar-specific transcriptional regulator TrmB
LADFLSKQRAEIDRRLKELRPAIEEYQMLERAREALEGVTSPRRGPGRPRGSRNRGPAKQRRRRRGGTRREQALKLVKSNPGITVGELAKQLRIRQNYLYRVMGELRDEGAVKKQGRGYTAA